MKIENKIKYSKKDLGIVDNKDVKIEKIDSIFINNFRSFSERKIVLGDVVTVLVGRNGTMKTTLMGLLAHPFDSLIKDAFGKELKTSFKDVFKLSNEHDNKPYSYDLNIKICGSNKLLSEEVRVYYVTGKTNRFRVVVSGANSGDGNFKYNTSFLNMKRLLPMVDVNAAPISIDLSAEEKKLQQNFYETVFSKNGFGSFSAVKDGVNKSTFAPVGASAKYGYESISSGEDNLGAIFNKMIGYVRSFDASSSEGNGIFCIDEFEASLHPVAQIKLLNFLYSWAQKYKVQIIITTHSLHLIQDIYTSHFSNMSANRITINFFSCSEVGSDNNYPILINPNYNLAYKELTFKEPIEVINNKKISIFLEDDCALMFFKKIVKSTKILSAFNFKYKFESETKNPGTPYSALISLCKNFPDLLKESIVILDPDVKENITNGIKAKNTFLLLPDAKNVALERRMIAYIVGLENDDKFFKKFKKEKAIFISEIKDAGVVQAEVHQILDEQITKIDHCKKWAKNSASSFKMYVGYYCDNELKKDLFMTSLINRVNEINIARGMPIISIK
ncbi:ATP-binding protein [Iodobacter sp. HSC-16F04]|uniref:ATP-binding protein n=1 Tax=Iodobacter violaceini TaxID=3044271 RepID=A0ABX0KS51_9NEIS|nr:AAA family ATPase [Iodobacter violacea]NHQ84869.1 ATP-binding protein [Iodobacter violacea]